MPVESGDHSGGYDSDLFLFLVEVEVEMMEPISAYMKLNDVATKGQGGVCIISLMVGVWTLRCTRLLRTELSNGCTRSVWDGTYLCMCVYLSITSTDQLSL